MHQNYYSILTALLLMSAPLIGSASSLRCDGTVISQGDTEQQLLEACGSPTAVEGSEWLYELPGELPTVVTIGQGTVMFIRSLDESDAFTNHPMGDQP